MARPRSDGGTSLTRCPSIMRSPAVISSSPAIIRSSVDLPQPDGPTKTQNSRSSIGRSTPLMTCDGAVALLDALERDGGHGTLLPFT